MQYPWYYLAKIQLSSQTAEEKSRNLEKFFATLRGIVPIALTSMTPTAIVSSIVESTSRQLEGTFSELEGTFGKLEGTFGQLESTFGKLEGTSIGVEIVSIETGWYLQKSGDCR